jgi:hypothetical protein
MTLPTDRIYESIRNFVEHLPESESIKVSLDSEAKILRIYHEDSSVISRASSGLKEVMELSYTTAEHHPYWSILYHSSHITKSVLDSWDDKLTTDQISEIEWRCQEVIATIQRISKA